MLMCASVCATTLLLLSSPAILTMGTVLREVMATVSQIQSVPYTVSHGHKKSGSPYRVSRKLSDEDPQAPPGQATNAPWEWENAGGEFGLSADWQKAVLLPGSGEDIRGERCLSDENQEQVRQILARRDRTAATEKVAACVRTKDRGRYMSEWIAYHYALGVDDIYIYDDDSVDGTPDILKPFIDAGIVHYTFSHIAARRYQLRPLEGFLKQQIDARLEDNTAPKWLAFHDSDEYIFPLNTTLTLPEVLQENDNTCCTQIHRVQYGSSGFSETPPGLLLETFLKHASPGDDKANRLPKFIANLDPAHPEEGMVTPRLRGPHSAQGCQCNLLPVDKLRINHYLGSIGDYMDNKRRYWKENYSLEEVNAKAADRDRNDETSDTIIHWACATREILARVVEGLDPRTGLPISPKRS